MKSLRGEPAEIYLRWERELKPCGFHFAACVLDYPEGTAGPNSSRSAAAN
jgi:hypothetical protein